MAHLVADTEQSGILSTLPGIDVEISLSKPTEGPVWRSVVGDVRIASGFSTTRGRSTELDQFQAGTCSLVLDNRDRQFDPDYVSSPIADYIKPQRRMRILANYNSIQYVVFDGFVDSFDQEYDVSGQDATAQIQATDGFKMLAKMDLPQSTYEFLYGSNTSLTKPTNVWKFDESAGSMKAIDSVGGVDFNVNGTVTFGAESVIPYGAENAAVQFSGAINNYLSSSSLPFGASTGYTGPFTIEAWARVDAFPNPAGDQGQYSLISWDSGDFGFTTKSLYMSGGQAYSYARSSIGSTATGTAYHVAVTQDTFAGATKFYVNGTAVSTASFVVLNTFSVAYPGTRVAFLDAGNQFAPITVGPIYAYNSILTAGEIATHYSYGTQGEAGIDTGARVNEVLQFVPWPTTDVDVDTGSSTLMAHSINGASALEYLQTLFETERGQFYMGLDGNMSTKDTFNVVWRSRGSLTTATRSITSQATFGDANLAYSSIEFKFDETQLANDVVRGRSGGTAQRLANDDSISTYFRRANSKTDLLFETDSDAYDAAGFFLNKYKDPHIRIESVVIRPQSDPTNLWPQVLGREIGDRVTIQLTPQQVGSAISRDLIIEGVSHNFADGFWETSWKVSPADSTVYWILGDATYSVLDTTTVLGW